MPGTDKNPLAEIIEQKPGKVKPIEFKKIPEGKLRFKGEFEDVKIK